MINVAGKIFNSLTNGPGLRYTLFTQGCPHHCVGCHNEHTWKFEDVELIDSDVIFNSIKEMPYISGVTFSGGEPFMQAEALYKLGKRIKEELGISLMAYSGYTFEEIKAFGLMRSEEMQYKVRLLNILDILVDGKFEVDKQEGALKYTGSTNQRILYLKGGEIIDDIR